MEPDYSKAGLNRFLDTAASQGLVKGNIINGWRAAVTRIFADIRDPDDVRKIDIPTEIKRYHNRHPGVLKGTSLKEYERRLTYAVTDFVAFTTDPTSYKGRGRGPDTTDKPEKSGRIVQKRQPKQLPAESRVAQEMLFDSPASAGLSLAFPLRPDFLATVLVPRDMKADEARRLSRFIMTLAQDYNPATNEV